MGFHTRTNEYFTAFAVEAGTGKKRELIGRGTRAAVISAVKEGPVESQSEWLIELRRSPDDGELQPVVLASWASTVGAFPPASRAQVPGLN